MKAIMVMFDSLNRHMLPPYGCDWVHAPNFKRLAERSVTFDTSFVGSMPCMPARRELHTGRYNFLHRSWGPLEPFDDSMPELLKSNGIYSHLASDHYHYWEEGGCTYHTRYSTWESFRGQEGDAWMADLNDPQIQRMNADRGDWGRQDWINRSYMQNEQNQPQAKTFQAGMDFLRRNHGHDDWFLHLETFDPHEPYFTDKKYKDLYDYDYSKFSRDWPQYARLVEGDEDLVTHMKFCNAALISMCDEYLGRVLSAMDEYDLWDDTMLIINTDHGFLLGEHGWWAKVIMPFYNEIANTPLFIWDPRSKVQGARRQSLVQTIDLPATILDFFGIDLPPDMEGIPLAGTIVDDTPVRSAGLYGVFGGHVNVTDGRYSYMRAPASDENTPLFEYTLMPTHMRHTFEVEELQDIRLADPCEFTKGCRTMKIPGLQTAWFTEAHQQGTLLFDNTKDPRQFSPLRDARAEAAMIEHLVREMRKNHAPKEQFTRLGLT